MILILIILGVNSPLAPPPPRREIQESGVRRHRRKRIEKDLAMTKDIAVCASIFTNCRNYPIDKSLI
ncbi:MAG: hypothetical protein F6K06_18845 [Okeania sp. SIO1H4]|uniref:hypothetical protein n=1 Tax=Okeania TaxID=1458928 RepID=UPI000F54B8BE|nr:MULTISPECIES: hypothetical protein [Okeania]NES77724.1 hypothetical protein [Okeania sp. SIO1H4]NES88846.1 hypothetical protein [Okeania sp. SIO2B9]NEP92517.1 hypothetical protein [Okeania sp. SIO2F5]NEQ92070.1 hypothetical protein [Okeania sp. SIO2G4]NET78045.1 hypothetical protein [Okeania sp. SIO1F9]